MKIVGLTGGIASGKSTVTSLFRSAGSNLSNCFTKRQVYVVDADTIARQVVEPGQPAYNALVQAFGSVILSGSNDSAFPNTSTSTSVISGAKKCIRSIDRAVLGTLVFSDPQARSTVNACTHPYIRLEMLRQVLWAFLCMYSICLMDIPLLYESGLDRWMNHVIVVYCPKSMQLERLMRRNAMESEEAQSRINSQTDIEEKRMKAEFVIDNSRSVGDTESQVELLLPKLMHSSLITLALWCLGFFPALCLYMSLNIYVFVYLRWQGHLWKLLNRIASSRKAVSHHSSQAILFPPNRTFSPEERMALFAASRKSGRDLRPRSKDTATTE